MTMQCRHVGATAVLLTPVVMTGEGDGPMGQAPMSFFAPNPALAVDQSPLAASQELKHVVRELHAHGIEVILQVRCPPSLPLPVCCVLHMYPSPCQCEDVILDACHVPSAFTHLLEDSGNA